MSAAEQYGTFKDSLQAPIHRWFTYPAGYSYKLVEAKIGEHGIRPGQRVGDPFVGTGTTCLAAKLLGVDSVGVEAHPFVHGIAQAKMDFEHSVSRLEKEAMRIQGAAADMYETPPSINGWPDLVYKCFSEDNLTRLAVLRAAVEAGRPRYRPFFKVALTATLRDTTSAGAGWPYIAPSKFAERKVQRDAFAEFEKRSALMVRDVASVMARKRPASRHQVVQGDARMFSCHAGAQSLDMVLTSPPYLNNYDYADRTRLETYFWGLYESWSEITEQVRDRLIVAATTQIRRCAMSGAVRLPGIASVSPSVHESLSASVDALTAVREEKRGKKSYDLMAANYFEDMLKVLLEVYISLRPGAPFILVLGDSAPYGVHIATDELIAQLSLDIGFSEASIQVIRTRGDKWAGNPQRHKVPLRESIVTLIK